jgi:hypothetical protein
MSSFETECRRLIDGLARELVALASDLAQSELRAARAVREKAERAARAQAERKAPKVSARLAKALERAEERRRLAAERRAQKLAARAARRQSGTDAPAASTRTRARPAAAAAPAVPPPLFVHKRSRDGSIQKLERAADAPPPAPPVAVPV